MIEDSFSILGVDVSLYRQKAGGNLFAYFTVGKKRHRVTTKQANTRSAREAARAIVARVAAARNAAQGTIAEAADDMLATRWPDGTEDNRTYADQRRRLKTFKEKCGSIRLNLSREEMSLEIQRYIDGRTGLAAQTVINEQRVISGLFSWLMKTQRVTHWSANPASTQFLTLPPNNPTPKHIATQEEIDALLGKAKESFRAAVVLILSGLRPAGAIRCRWADIDFEARTLTTKEKNRTRVIRLSPWACEELKAIEHEAKTIWPRKHRHFFSTFQTHARALKIANLTPYSLRRAVVARLWSAGWSAEQAAKALGHSVAVATKHYRALESVRDVADTLDWRNIDKVSIKAFHTEETKKNESR